MGGNDVYCALCGAPFGQLYWENEEGEDNAYDPNVLTSPEDPELLWLDDSRIIGENPESDALCKVWLSGPAHHGYHGSMSFDVGDDTENMLEDTASIGVYAWNDEMPFSVPFHVCCRELLCQYLGIQVSELDKHVFFEALKSKSTQEYFDCQLKIEYGDIDEEMGQYWSTDRDMEYFVFNPLEDKQFQRFIEDLPKNDIGDHKSIITHNTTGDPFTGLPPDILLNILSQTQEPAAIYALRRASPRFSNLHLSQGFWRQLIGFDMPWFWKLADISRQESASGIDWESVYKTICCGTLPPFEGRDKFRGLANRRRIWEQILPQIAPAYWEAETKVKELFADTPEVLLGATGSNNVKRLVMSGSGDEVRITQTLVDQFEDLASANPSLLFDWTDSGQLLAIRVLNNGHNENAKRYPSSQTPEKTDKVHIPDGTWPTGFVFISHGSTEKPLSTKRQIVGVQIFFTNSELVSVGSDDGDKRLIRVEEDNFAVAFTTVYSEDGTLHGFAILQHPSSSAPGSQRVVDNLRGNHNAAAEPYLWRHELLSSSVCLSPIHGMTQNEDIVPVEQFVFGSSSEELADITSIAVDLQLGGFQVDYSNRPNRSVGPRLQALKTLAIDGQGGERIVNISVTSRSNDGMPVALRIDTNRNRTLIVGESPRPGISIEVNTPGVKLYPGGLVASWSGSQPTQTLRNIGIFGYPAVDHVDEPEMSVPQVDENGFSWEPQTPSELKEDGPIFGKRKLYDDFGSLSKPIGEKPSAGCVVSWLDCGRPLSEVRVTLVHSTYSSQVQISALTFKYSDGGEETAGPDRFATDSPCGWCNTGYSVREERRQHPSHYRHETWNVGGKKLASLRMWLVDSQPLSAVQFVAEGQTVSPVWGVWEHDAAEMEPSLLNFAGERDGKATALKLFLQHNERTATMNETVQNDTIVCAIQAMVPGSQPLFSKEFCHLTARS